MTPTRVPISVIAFNTPAEADIRSTPSTYGEPHTSPNQNPPGSYNMNPVWHSGISCKKDSASALAVGRNPRFLSGYSLPPFPEHSRQQNTIHHIFHNTFILGLDNLPTSTPCRGTSLASGFSSAYRFNTFLPTLLRPGFPFSNHLNKGMTFP